MGKINFYFYFSSLVLGALVTSCTVPGSQKDPTVVVVPSPATTPAVIVTPVPQIVANPGLIQSTNPNERLKQVKVANKDPFAANQPTALIITANPAKESATGQPASATGVTASAGSGQPLIIGATSPNADITPVGGNATANSGSKRVVRAKSSPDEAKSQTGNKAQGAKNSQAASKSQATAKGAKSSNASSQTGGTKESTQTAKKGSKIPAKTNIAKNPASNGSSSGRPTVPSLPSDSNTPPIAANPGSPSANPGGDLGQPSIPDTAPQSQLASQIVVSGVVQVDNGTSYAIIRGPNEKSSSNLLQGDTVPNTTVLVKRIQAESGDGRMSGMVVLEENGVEITKAVGEKVAGAEAEAPAPQGGTTSYPGSEAVPPETGTPVPGSQRFSNPTGQPVSNPSDSGIPPGQPVPNPTGGGNLPTTVPNSTGGITPTAQPFPNSPGIVTPTVEPVNSPSTIVPTPVVSPQLSPNGSNFPEDR